MHAKFSIILLLKKNLVKVWSSFLEQNQHEQNSKQSNLWENWNPNSLENFTQLQHKFFCPKHNSHKYTQTWQN
jgi:hypothetical protein